MVYCIHNSESNGEGPEHKRTELMPTPIDLDTGECTVVNAGHEHPALDRKSVV